MNPAEISLAYEKLFQNHPSLRPSVTGSHNYYWKFCHDAWRAVFNEDQPSDYPFRDAIPEYTALDVCLMSCIRECTNRVCPVGIDIYEDEPEIKKGFNFDSVFISVKNMHSILAVMDEVMTMPKVK